MKKQQQTKRRTALCIESELRAPQNEKSSVNRWDQHTSDGSSAKQARQYAVSAKALRQYKGQALSVKVEAIHSIIEIQHTSAMISKVKTDSNAIHSIIEIQYMPAMISKAKTDGNVSCVAKQAAEAAQKSRKRELAADQNSLLPREKDRSRTKSRIGQTKQNNKTQNKQTNISKKEEIQERKAVLMWSELKMQKT